MEDIAMPRMMLLVGVVLAVVNGAARGDDEPAAALNEAVIPASGFQLHHRGTPVCPGSPGYPDCQTPGVMPDNTMPPVTPPPDLSGLNTPFATQTGGGGLQGRSFNESFDGDFGGVFYAKNVTITTIQRQQIGTTRQVILVRNPVSGQPPFIQRTIFTPVFGNVPVTTTQRALVAVPGRYSGISITDNDSPRPVDRVYFTYGYYDGMGAQVSPGIGNITQNRPMVGFEKTFLDGNASFGMRLPFVELNGPVGVDGQSVGDLSILTKYAFINNPNGDVVSAGLILTTPTAASGGTLVD